MVLKYLKTSTDIKFLHSLSLTNAATKPQGDYNESEKITLFTGFKSSCQCSS